MKLLLGIDPGLLTGLFCVDITDPLNPVQLWSEEFSIKQFHDFIEKFLESNRDDLRVVIEDFLITARTSKLSAQPWSLHLIGLMNYLCYKYDVPLTIQKPSDKQFADNTKLKKIGFWHTAGGGHALDAGRHCLVWLINKHPQVAKNLI